MIKINKLYITRQKKKWEELAGKNYEVLHDASVQTIEDGYILPLKYLPNETAKSYNTFTGGVLNKHQKFITGHYRNNVNYDMTQGYSIETPVVYDDRTVIYGGLLFDIFGHAFTESFARLWCITELDCSLPIVFASKNLKYIVPQYFYDFMELLGIDKNRIILASKITQYKKIIIPDQALVLFQGFDRKLRGIYDIISRNALKKYKGIGFDRVYLSRAAFERSDCIGEQFFEHFYAVRGYEVIYPEMLPLYEQIAIASQAKEIVCTGGTLSHLLLFASDDCKATILLRHSQEPMGLFPQFIVNQLKDIDVTWVDISYNFLPTTHACGIFYVKPTKDFINYLTREGISYYDEELKENSTALFTYIQRYTDWYTKNNYGYKRLKDRDFFSCINNMSEIINNKSLKRDLMKTPDKNLLIRDMAKEQEEYKDSLLLNKRERALIADAFPEIAARLEQPFLFWKMHVAYKGWLDTVVEGQELDLEVYSGNRMEAVEINLMNVQDLDLRYRVCTEKSGWQAECTKGKVAGNVGKSDAIRGIQIKLLNSPHYSIAYRVGYGKDWSRWYHNGEQTEIDLYPQIERLECKLERNKANE